MTAHKPKRGPQATGAVDKDQRSPRTKMDRESPNTDDRRVPDADLRGGGRQAKRQQAEEQRQRDDVRRRGRRPGKGDPAGEQTSMPLLRGRNQDAG
jgi:hypothetical protein